MAQSDFRVTSGTCCGGSSGRWADVCPAGRRAWAYLAALAPGLLRGSEAAIVASGTVNQRTGDQEGGRAGESRGACTAALDGVAEEGRSGQAGREVIGGGGTRRRRNRGNAGDTEGEGRAGAVGKRGRQGEEGGEEGGGKRQDRKMERQWRKRNRGDG